MRVEQMVLVGVLATWLLGCAEEAPPPAAPEAPADAAPSEPAPAAPQTANGLPNLITLERGGVIPEGIEYDQNQNVLLVGSLSEGTVFEVNPDGSLVPFIEDSELRSSVGIEVDEPRNRLLVANSDAGVFQGTVPGQARLGVYDARSKARLAMVDLAATVPNEPADARHFANDVTVDDAGTAFVTDSMSGSIYRVDTAYTASVFHQFPAQDQFMINGLVYHPSGALLVVDMVGGRLYRVPVTDPMATAEVTLPEPIRGADGAVWQDENQQRLAIVSNSENRVVVLTSTDNWASAQLAGSASFEGQGTTAASVDGEIYVVQPHFEDPEPATIVHIALP
jgi:sugar lactone lactonase YvrE